MPPKSLIHGVMETEMYRRRCHFAIIFRGIRRCGFCKGGEGVTVAYSLGLACPSMLQTSLWVSHSLGGIDRSQRNPTVDRLIPSRLAVSALLKPISLHSSTPFSLVRFTGRAAGRFTRSNPARWVAISASLTRSWSASNSAAAFASKIEVGVLSRAERTRAMNAKGLMPRASASSANLSIVGLLSAFSILLRYVREAAWARFS